MPDSIQEVQQSVRTRDEFLAAAAHDLKTPLASTRAIAQLLRNRVQRMQLPDGDRVTGGLDRIDESVMRMTALIDELEVETAIDGVDALQRAAHCPPGLVVLDMGLPGLDGFRVAAELRERHGGELPILVVTADGQARQKADRVGAYGYLHKPFDVGRLVHEVRAGLSLR